MSHIASASAAELFTCHHSNYSTLRLLINNIADFVLRQTISYSSLYVQRLPDLVYDFLPITT